MSAAMLNAKRARMKVEATASSSPPDCAAAGGGDEVGEGSRRRTGDGDPVLKTRQQQGELEKEAVKHEEEARLTAHREHP